MQGWACDPNHVSEHRWNWLLELLPSLSAKRSALGRTWEAHIARSHHVEKVSPESQVSIEEQSRDRGRTPESSKRGLLSASLLQDAS